MPLFCQASFLVQQQMYLTLQCNAIFFKEVVYSCIISVIMYFHLMVFM